jgi:hypothetical protein
MLLYEISSLQPEVSYEVIQNCWLLRQFSEGRTLRTHNLKISRKGFVTGEAYHQKGYNCEKVLLIMITDSNPFSQKTSQ